MLVSWCTPHILLIFSSLDEFIDCFTANIVDLRFFFFWAFWFSEKIYTAVWYCRSTEAGTHMHRSPFYLAAAASWGCVMADTQLRGETHGCLHDAYMLTHRIHTHKCRRWLSLFRSRMQTHLAALCDWFRTDGAGVTVSDASLLMYPDEIITQPFCSSAGQPVS